MNNKIAYLDKKNNPIQRMTDEYALFTLKDMPSLIEWLQDDKDVCLIILHSDSPLDDIERIRKQTSPLICILIVNNQPQIITHPDFYPLENIALLASFQPDELFYHQVKSCCQRTLQSFELQACQKLVHDNQVQLLENEKLAALGGMVSGVAHEVNTPVGIGITSASHLLEETQQIKQLFDAKKIKKSHMQNYLETALESSELIVNNLQRASQLVRSFKQISSDQISEDEREYTLPHYIDDILLSLKPKLKRTPYKINIICEQEILILGYPGAFSQILTNLIMNTLIHAYEKDQAGTITITSTLTENQVSLIYADNGNGIAIENIDKIFDPFFTTKKGSGGTGLGLNIVRTLVQKTLKGSITCQSNEQGTQFCLTFPQTTH